MTKGREFASECITFTDPISGVTVKQLTNWNAHNFHLYFTNSGWYETSKLLFGSDRGNRTNLYSMDLTTGKFVQLTDLDQAASHGIQGTFINPTKHEAYFTSKGMIVAISLENYEERVLYRLPEGYRFSNLSCTADGENLCFGLTEDLTMELKSNLTGGYVGFEETEARRPHSQICVISLKEGKVQVVHEEKRWIGHVNASPTQANLLSFCHEGPWEKVDHRIWMMDLSTREVWKIRGGVPGQYAGHEYWHSDGIHIGYHGFTGNLKQKEGKFLGVARFDDTEREEYEFPYQNMHIHSNDFNLIVGDGQQASAYHGENYQDCVFIWKRTEKGMEGPRILCKHRGSFHVQQIHVHPRFNPDGSQVLFTSDMSGYGNLYMVDLPEFESLPLLQDGKLVR